MIENENEKQDIRHESLCKDVPKCAIVMRTYQSNQTLQSLPILFVCEQRQNTPSSCVHLLHIISTFLLQPYLDQTYAMVLVGPYLLEQFYSMLHSTKQKLSATEKTMMTSLWRVQTYK